MNSRFEEDNIANLMEDFKIRLEIDLGQIQLRHEQIMGYLPHKIRRTRSTSTLMSIAIKLWGFLTYDDQTITEININTLDTTDETSIDMKAHATIFKDILTTLFK